MTIAKIIIIIERIFEVCFPENMPAIPLIIIKNPMMWNWRDIIIGVANILVVNMNPNITANIPDMISRPPIPVPPKIHVSIAKIHNKRKLRPNTVEATAVMKTGQIININPHIIDNIPKI